MAIFSLLNWEFEILLCYDILYRLQMEYLVDDSEDFVKRKGETI